VVISTDIATALVNSRTTSSKLLLIIFSFKFLIGSLLKIPIVFSSKDLLDLKTDHLSIEKKGRAATNLRESPGSKNRAKKLASKAVAEMLMSIQVLMDALKRELATKTERLKQLAFYEAKFEALNGNEAI
jgi:hypothetical protein